MESSSCRTAILEPFSPHYLPEPAPDEPLFLPAGAQRNWYLGWLERWTEFEEKAYSTWVSLECKSAFDEIKDYNVKAPREADPDPTRGGERLLTDRFRREVVEMVEEIYGQLLTTTTMKEAGGGEIPTGMQTVKGDGDNPRFVVLATPADDNRGVRLLGHAEYLGGKPGALTWAIKENAKNSWGSLRCVLGKLLIQRIQRGALGFAGSFFFDLLTIIQETSRNGCYKAIPTSASSPAPTKSSSSASMSTPM
jgi:hypothetical protein